MILRLTLRIIVSKIESMTFGLRKQKKGIIKTISDYKMDMLVKQGRDQFKKLIEKGINIPVALL